MKNTKSLDQLKTQYYGEVGTPERDRIERELEALRIGFKLRSAREQQSLTQEEVAKRINKNIVLKTFCSIVIQFISIHNTTSHMDLLFTLYHMLWLLFHTCF